MGIVVNSVSSDVMMMTKVEAAVVVVMMAVMH